MGAERYQARHEVSPELNVSNHSAVPLGAAFWYTPRMERDQFEQLVSEGLERIPAKFRVLIKNVAILIADAPTPEQLRRNHIGPGSTLLGLYEGVPRAARYGQEPLMPDKITIFQQPIESVAATPEAVREQVAKTVWHEIGHHFGLSEHAVRTAERRRSSKPLKKSS